MEAQCRSYFSEWTEWTANTLKPAIHRLQIQGKSNDDCEELKQSVSNELKQLARFTRQLTEPSRQRPSFNAFIQSAQQHHSQLWETLSAHRLTQQKQTPATTASPPRGTTISNEQPAADAQHESNPYGDDPPSSPTLESLGLSKRSLALFGQYKTPPPVVGGAQPLETPTGQTRGGIGDEMDPLATPILATQRLLNGGGGNRHSFSSVESPNITSRFRFSMAPKQSAPQQKQQQQQQQQESLLNYLEHPDDWEFERVNNGQLSFGQLCECIDEINEFFTESQLRGVGQVHNSFSLRDLQEQAGLGAMAAPVLTVLLRMKRIGVSNVNDPVELRRYRLL